MAMTQQQLEEAAAEAAKVMYRLDRIAHVSNNVNVEPIRCVLSVRTQQQMDLDPRIEPHLESAGLLPLARLNQQWFKLDELLVSTFVERWRFETHNFHMFWGSSSESLHLKASSTMGSGIAWQICGEGGWGVPAIATASSPKERLSSKSHASSLSNYKLTSNDGDATCSITRPCTGTET
ncbi:hypothetical protein PIB30_068726 [Stylosanthes scabra]|uniref:Aminotransferase-like plant mobile domain-containing protein n=1 Tax=Stylosanthes scabra TaxID=79078 RepID=A0ABU6YLX5_9FABA|nr:hypothetical protein [Stylosanthes scabra]